MLNSIRDYRRNNKTNAAIQGAILGKISLSCIEKIKCAVAGNENATILDEERKKTFDCDIFR